MRQRHEAQGKCWCNIRDKRNHTERASRTPSSASRVAFVGQTFCLVDGDDGRKCGDRVIRSDSGAAALKQPHPHSLGDAHCAYLGQPKERDFKG